MFLSSPLETYLTNNLQGYIIQDMLSLSEELKVVSGRKRRFILLRIIDVGTEAARQLCGITQGTYNSWLHDAAFTALYRRRAELAVDFRVEALRMMRRDNQLQAVLLEEKIINKMKDEIESGNYDLIRSNLAREVYSKLIADLDYQPQSLSLSWEQKIQQLTGQPTLQIEGGAVPDGEFVETTGESQAEHTESQPPPESKQASDEVKKKVKKG